MKTITRITRILKKMIDWFRILCPKCGGIMLSTYALGGHPDSLFYYCPKCGHKLYTTEVTDENS